MLSSSIFKRYIYEKEFQELNFSSWFLFLLLLLKFNYFIKFYKKIYKNL